MNEIARSDVTFQFTQFIAIAILILIIVFIVKVYRLQSKQIDKKTIINIIIDIVIILILWLVLEFIGVNTAYLVPKIVEWATKFILPWVVLYWLIRLIKSIEKK